MEYIGISCKKSNHLDIMDLNYLDINHLDITYHKTCFLIQFHHHICSKLDDTCFTKYAHITMTSGFINEYQLIIAADMIQSVITFIARRRVDIAMATV